MLRVRMCTCARAEKFYRRTRRPRLVSITASMVRAYVDPRNVRAHIYRVCVYLHAGVGERERERERGKGTWVECARLYTLTMCKRLKLLHRQRLVGTYVS